MKHAEMGRSMLRPDKETSRDCGGSGLPENRNEALGQGKGTEEQQHVKGVSCQGVPEQWQAGEVTSGQTAGGFWIGVQEPPSGEVGDQKELNGAEESCGGNARDSAAASQKAADEDTEKETGVDDEHHAELVKADKQISSEEREQREGKRKVALFDDCAGKQSHRANGSEVPGMRRDAESGSDSNDDESEQQAIKQIVMRIFTIHL